MVEQQKSEQQDLQAGGLTPEEQKMRKQRNLAIALGLAVFVVLVFAVTVLRIGGDIAQRSF